MPEATAAAHASSLVAMSATAQSVLTAFWFAGDRESASNVQIAASQFDRVLQQWTPARFVVNRHALGAQLGFGVRRLGNPVAWLDAQDRMHLFVVATGWGGWAASRIVHLRQSSASNQLDALAFEPVRLLPLSWLWNTSFLVRNAPLPLRGGGMLLPVHFELGVKYPVALRFDRDGVFSGMVRMSGRLDALQPSVIMRSETEWLAFLRSQRPNGKVGVAHTLDGGAHWNDLPDLTLDNPDAAIAALGVGGDLIVMAHNPSTQSRTQLDLSVSVDAVQWQTLAVVERGTDGDEFSYPSLVVVDGELWVSYTQNRKCIAWHRWTASPAASKVTP